MAKLHRSGRMTMTAVHKAYQFGLLPVTHKNMNGNKSQNNKKKQKMAMWEYEPVSNDIVQHDSSICQAHIKDQTVTLFNGKKVFKKLCILLIFLFKFDLNLPSD